MNIYLGKHFEAMIRAKVATGRYANASEVVREALRLMEHDDEKLARLRAKIDEGLASIKRGEYIEVTDVRAFIDDIMQRAHERAKAKAAEPAHVAS